MQPQKCSNGPSSLSSDDHMQQVHHHRHPNQKSAIATTATTAASAGAASSASPLFPTSLRHHFQQMDQEGFDHVPPPHDDFIEQMLSSLNPASAWQMKNGCENDSASPEEESENGVSTGGFQFDETSKLRAQQMFPIRFDGMDDVVHHSGTLLEGSSYDSFHPGVENQMAGLFNGSLVRSLLGSGQQMNHLPEHFHGSQGGPAFDQVSVAMNSNGQAPMDGTAEAAATQPKQRVRARRGQATDPHSIAERLRRERIAERMKGLQELVPNANKTDKASMLDEIIEYVKFLQLQVKVLSMSRLGGAGAVAPLLGDNMSSVGDGDSLKARAKAMMRRGGSNGGEVLTAASTEDTTVVNEKEVAKLLEEDMGSAMQYLQSKGLCLMPISLAAAISTTRNPVLSSSSSTKRAGTNSSPKY